MALQDLHHQMGSQARQVVVALLIPADDEELGGNIHEIGGLQFLPDKHLAAAHQVTDRFPAPNRCRRCQVWRDYCRLTRNMRMAPTSLKLPRRTDGSAGRIQPVDATH